MKRTETKPLPDPAREKPRPKEKEIFEKPSKKPVEPKVAETPKQMIGKRRRKPTESKPTRQTPRQVRDGGLRISLKQPNGRAFSRPELIDLLRYQVGDQFTYLGSVFRMTERLKRQIEAAVGR